MSNAVLDARKTEHPVDPIFPSRWSPRAMSGESLSREALLSLFEAARWAPSSSNGQPWRFVYATRESQEWPLFMSFLVEFNQAWTKNAAALVVAVSRKDFDNNGKSVPVRTHAFDTGSAWMSLALQASLKGLVAHGMAGFDYDKAKAALKIPDNYEVQAMIALGKPGKKEDLPKALQEREFPSGRKPLSETVFEGTFKAT
ncbi:MAG TPA: nitroreductase family protein [Elusimicrobiota bacterium]|nr:nitroreductase family protein [Elusimicrobiota bacterium]